MAQPAFLYFTPGSTATAKSLVAADADNVLIQTEDTFYQPPSAAAFSIVVDLGAAAAVDYFGIVGKDLDGVSVTVTASTDDFVASDVAISSAANLSAPVNAAWRSFTTGTYRYWKLAFTGHTTAIRIAHIALGTLALLPYFKSDYDEDSVNTDAKQMVSPSGYFVGATQQKAMRELPLEIGEVTASELTNILSWRNECVTTSRPFFFVPDTSASVVYWGWTEGQFRAPFEENLYKVSSFTFITRAA